MQIPPNSCLKTPPIWRNTLFLYLCIRAKSILRFWGFATSTISPKMITDFTVAVFIFVLIKLGTIFCSLLTTRATGRLAESCEIVRTTNHRVSVVSFEDQGSFGVLFCVGPEQGLERLPWLRPAYRATASPMIMRGSWLVTRLR